MSLKGEYSELFDKRLQANLEKTININDKKKEELKCDIFIQIF